MNDSCRAIVVAAALALGACGGSEPGASREAGTDGKNQELLKAVQQPLDRAHGVEDIEAGRKGDLDKEIEGATQ